MIRSQFSVFFCLPCFFLLLVASPSVLLRLELLELLELLLLAELLLLLVSSVSSLSELLLLLLLPLFFAFLFFLSGAGLVLMSRDVSHWLRVSVACPWKGGKL